jgi:hypothetical protein
MTKHACLAVAATLLLAGCAHTPAAPPAWSDDSRSDLAAQGTSVAPGRNAPPPQAATVTAPEAPPAPPAVAPAAAPEPRAEDDVPLPPNAPVVHVLDLGTSPRKLLRYRLAGSSTEDVNMTLGTTMATSMAGGPQGPEIATPQMRMIMSMTGAPAGKGEISALARVTDADIIDGPGVLPMLKDQVRTELRKMVGMTIDTHMTTRGAVIKIDTTLPPDAPASMRNTFDNLQSSFSRSGVLPAEPVGVGARWESETDLQQGGISIHEHGRYLVRELVGSRVGIDVEFELNAGPQEMKVPSAPTTLHLDGMRGTGSGTMDLDLGSVVPRKQHLAMDTDMSMRMPVGGRDLAMTMRMKMTIDVHAGR